MTYHKEGDIERARSHLNDGWSFLEDYFSINLHHKYLDGAACLSFLLVEARRKITGESLPNDHFFREVARSRRLPEKSLRILERGAEWRYLHPANGVDPATNDPDFHGTFFHADFDDSDWTKGREDDGPLSGFGYGPRAVVEWEKPEEGLHTSAYLRCHFTTAEAFASLNLRFQVNDAAIVYLDGKEAGRIGLRSSKSEAFGLGADIRVKSKRENSWKSVDLEGRLSAGDHVLAISLHSNSSGTSDLRIGNIVLFGEPDDAKPLARKK